MMVMLKKSANESHRLDIKPRGDASMNCQCDAGKIQLSLHP